MTVTLEELKQSERKFFVTLKNHVKLIMLIRDEIIFPVTQKEFVTQEEFDLYRGDYLEKIAVAIEFESRVVSRLFHEFRYIWSKTDPQLQEEFIEEFERPGKGLYFVVITIEQMLYSFLQSAYRGGFSIEELKISTRAYCGSMKETRKFLEGIYGSAIGDFTNEFPDPDSSNPEE